MFYDVFKQLCNDRGETPNSVCIKLGLSQAAAPYWKKSGKRPKRETLEVIAKYFGVSIDLLLERDVQSVRESIISGNMAKENAPTKLSRSELFNILGQLTDSELDEVLDFAEYLLLKRQSQAE